KAMPTVLRKARRSVVTTPRQESARERTRPQRSARERTLATTPHRTQEYVGPLKRGGASLNELVGSQQKRLRDRQAERLRCLEVDDQIELGRLLDRQIGGLGPLEDPINVNRRSSLHLRNIYPIGHEATRLDKDLELIDCRDPMRRRQIDDGLSMLEHKGWRRHQ